MTFCCRDLSNLKHFSKATLLAGEGGLNNEISWPYVRTTESISEWLYGGELLFVIYKDNKKDDENLYMLLEESIEKKLSGIVILIDNNYISSISEKMINRANEENLPLFIMPWDIKLIDIIQEIFFKIEQKREESKNAKHFFESLLFSQDQLCEDANGLAEFHNIKLRPYHYISMIKMKKISNTTSNESEKLNKDIINFLEEVLNNDNYTLIHMEYANYLMILIFANNHEDAKNSTRFVEDIFKFISSKYQNIDMNLSFSRIRNTNSEIKASYKEALKASSMIGIYNKDSKIIKYSELGILRLFVELADTKDIWQYCYENLGPILEYDKNHGMDLIGTLKCYFKNNRHLVKTSQELFIHRNTLLYRLSTIKNLLNKDLNDAMVDLELFNSILIYEFLTLKNK
ncbi:PucR family transcriptional regulator [Clostridium fallax]|uniref:Sugar diacid utilization regulator n=1 Tax=Clostridium fallax TaxID=1533 RepID=A0A1M4YC29_9CLOT|nr:PucR family transcriptional regulator [Clostridium fallax]SHF03136.1 Sugar diacid utilization regulator [Clostridium fallax]SQB05855.1 transcriptional regulatory protein [Clostridium fallax]